MTLTIGEIVGIITITVLIVGAFSFWFRKWLDSKFETVKTEMDGMKEDIGNLTGKQTSLDSSMANIRTNYIGKFQEAKDDIHRVKEEILEMLHKIELKLVSIEGGVNSQKEFYRSVQEAKKLNHFKGD